MVKKEGIEKNYKKRRKIKLPKKKKNDWKSKNCLNLEIRNLENKTNKGTKKETQKKCKEVKIELQQNSKNLVSLGGSCEVDRSNRPPLLVFSSSVCFSPSTLSQAPTAATAATSVNWR